MIANVRSVTIAMIGLASGLCVGEFTGIRQGQAATSHAETMLDRGTARIHLIVEYLDRYLTPSCSLPIPIDIWINIGKPRQCIDRLSGRDPAAFRDLNDEAVALYLACLRVAR
jgi:hypothetical protein